jgi:hypothetical protein
MTEPTRRGIAIIGLIQTGAVLVTWLTAAFWVRACPKLDLETPGIVLLCARWSGLLLVVPLGWTALSGYLTSSDRWDVGSGIKLMGAGIVLAVAFGLLMLTVLFSPMFVVHPGL